MELGIRAAAGYVNLSPTSLAHVCPRIHMSRDYEEAPYLQLRIAPLGNIQSGAADANESSGLCTKF